MQYRQLKEAMVSIKSWLNEDGALFGIAASLSESLETLRQLFLNLGLAGADDKPMPGVEAWQVIFAIDMLYWARLDKHQKGIYLRQNRPLSDAVPT